MVRSLFSWSLPSKPGEQPEGGWGSRPLPFSMGNLICALLATAFCPHFPKPRRSTSLEMIKIVSTVSSYSYQTPILRNSRLAIYQTWKLVFCDFTHFNVSCNLKCCLFLFEYSKLQKSIVFHMHSAINLSFFLFSCSISRLIKRETDAQQRAS